MYLHAYYHIFLSSRVLKIKNFLPIDFSPCYLNGKLRPFGGGVKSVELYPLTIWNIFYYFFGNFLHVDTDQKVDLGNKKRPNTYVNTIYLDIKLHPTTVGVGTSVGVLVDSRAFMLCIFHAILLVSKIS